MAAETVPREFPVEFSVAAPCFNEAEGIATVVADWNGILEAWPHPSEIVLCNDGSTDGTAEVLARLMQQYPRLRVVSFQRNGGYGRALSAAISATRGRVVVTMDSDGQFDLADGLRLLKQLDREQLDCVTGYRDGKKDSLFRVIADRVLNGIVRLMFGVQLRDTNCALKVARGEVLRGLRIEANGYPTPTEICLRLNAKGATLGEDRVTHRERVAGFSKLHPWKTAFSFLRFLWYLRGRIRLYRARIITEP